MEWFLLHGCRAGFGANEVRYVEADLVPTKSRNLVVWSELFLCLGR